MEEYDITVISNRGIFNGENGEISDFAPPTLHVFNKKASTFLETEFFLRPDVRARQNVLLLGDSLGDVTMSEGMGREEAHIIRVGFLNDRLERLPQYEEIYDVVILDDPGFEVIINLMKDIGEDSINALTTDATEETDGTTEENM
jgi:5'-nucleotidase